MQEMVDQKLTELRQEMIKTRRAAHAHRSFPDPQLHAKFKDCRRKFGKELKKAKHNHWWDWLKKATDPDLWTAQKYLSSPANDGGKTRIPDLIHTSNGIERKANSNMEKSKLLAKTFFPPKPSPAATSDSPTTITPTNQHQTADPLPVCKMDPITSNQI